jgi:hypothetical protein
MAADPTDNPPTRTSRLVLAADIGPTIRAAAFDDIDSSLRLLRIGESTPTGSSPQFDPEIGIAAALSDLDGALGAYADPGLPTPAAITGSRIGAALPALVFTDFPEPERVQLDTLLRANGFAIAGRVEIGSRRLLDRHEPEALARQILEMRPRLVMLALGDDTGWESLAAFSEILRFAVRGRAPGYSPAVAILYGEHPDQSMVNALNDAFITRVVDIRGPGDGFNVQAAGGALADLHRALVEELAFNGLRPKSLSTSRVVPLNAALGRVARSLAAEGDLTLAVIHVEAPGAMIVLSHQGAIRTGVFGYHRAGATVEHIGLELDLEELLRWVPFDITEAEAGAYFVNRAARPWTVPESHIEAALEQAASHMALRQAVQYLGEELPPLDLIACTGRNLTGAPRPVQAALIAINACLPGGYCQIALDRSGTLPAEGALLAAGIELQPGGGLVHLSTVIAGVGLDRPGRPALAVELRADESEPIQRQVNFGSMDRIMWDAASLGTVRGWPSGKLDVGGGHGRATTLRTRIAPGSGGLIIDARGRPIAWPEDVTHRRAAVLQWSQSTDSQSVPSPELELADEN